MAGHRDVALLGDKDKGRKGHPSGKTYRQRDRRMELSILSEFRW